MRECGIIVPSTMGLSRQAGDGEIYTPLQYWYLKAVPQRQGLLGAATKG